MQNNNREPSGRGCSLALVMVMVMALTSCSDTKMESSSEAFSSAADILNDESALMETIEIDALLKDDPRTRIFPLINFLSIHSRVSNIILLI